MLLLLSMSPLVSGTPRKEERGEGMARERKRERE
jgi:hypothetical protein